MMVSMSRGALVGIIVLFFLLGAGTLFNFFTSQSAVYQSQQRWCSTLDLLTAHAVAKPADPKANPSRENAYVFYVNLKKLHDEFGC